MDKICFNMKISRAEWKSSLEAVNNQIEPVVDWAIIEENKLEALLGIQRKTKAKICKWQERYGYGGQGMEFQPANL